VLFETSDYWSGVFLWAPYTRPIEPPQANCNP
jgi:hypothetical protein